MFNKCSLASALVLIIALVSMTPGDALIDSRCASGSVTNHPYYCDMYFCAIDKKVQILTCPFGYYFDGNSWACEQGKRLCDPHSKFSARSAGPIDELRVVLEKLSGLMSQKQLEDLSKLYIQTLSGSQ